MIRTSGSLWTYFSLLRIEKVKAVCLPHLCNTLCMSRICTSHIVGINAEHAEDVDRLNDGSERLRKRPLFSAMKNIYELSEEEMGNLMRKCSSLFNVNHKIIIENAKYLKEQGLSKNNLLSYSWVLGYNSNLLPSALNILKSLHHDVNVSLPLLEIPYTRLLELKASSNDNPTIGQSKVKWLSELLECDEYQLSQKLIKNYKVLKLPSDRILTVLNTLKDGGVALQDITKDIIILVHNLEVMEKRLAKAREKGVTNVKPWCLRCSEHVFRRFLARKVMAREFLGSHKTVKEYLITRLHCTEVMLSYITLKIPQLKMISVLKVKELLDYLYEVGYLPCEVLDVPRILTRSRKTVKMRVEELRTLGLEHPNLLVLCKTNREYREFIKKLRDGA